MIRGFLLVTWILGGIVSCGPRHHDTGAVRQWIGAQVVLCDSLSAVVDGHRAVLPCSDSLSEVKIVIYFDAEGCTPCRLKDLWQWKPWIEEYDSLRTVRFLFILNPSRTTTREVEQTLYGIRFTHPIFYDSTAVFERLNPELPLNPLFHTFMLDRNDHVVLVGSPIGNSRMSALYRRVIDSLTTTRIRQ